MVGLVYVDTLSLTPVQWAALGIHAAFWLWNYHAGGREWLLTAVLSFCALWYAFWNQFTCLDQKLLFEQTAYLLRLPWEAAIEAIPRRPYVEFQTPFLTYWFSRLPLFRLHQALWFPLGLLCVGLLRHLYGRSAALLIATPVFGLMIHQPCHDTLLFALLAITLRLIQLKQRIPAALVYGVSWMVKPLTILTAPFMLPRLGLSGLGSLGIWGGYLLWSRQWFFGRYQLRFLLQQLMLKPRRSTSSAKTAAQQVSQTAFFRTMWRRLWRTAWWRWTTLGRKAVNALPLYLFPAWLRPWTWQGLALGAVILLGYGNIKYLLLDLLFLFPVLEPAENSCS